MQRIALSEKRELCDAMMHRLEKEIKMFDFEGKGWLHTTIEVEFNWRPLTVYIELYDAPYTGDFKELDHPRFMILEVIDQQGAKYDMYGLYIKFKGEFIPLQKAIADLVAKKLGFEIQE